MPLDKNKLRASLVASADALKSSRAGEGYVAAISPCPVALIQMAIEFLDLTEKDCVFDLGCGDGRWLEQVLMATEKTKVVGVEMDQERLGVSRKALSRFEQGEWEEEEEKRFELIDADFCSVDISKATVVVVYLSRKGNLSIKQKLENECRKGTRIVAVGFTMAGWSPIKTFKVVKGIPSYVYEIKGEKEEEGESNKTRLEEQPEEEETNNKNNDTEGEGEGEEGNMHAHDAHDEHVHVDVPGWDWSYFLLVISLSSIADQSEMWTLGTLGWFVGTAIDILLWMLGVWGDTAFQNNLFFWLNLVLERVPGINILPIRTLLILLLFIESRSVLVRDLDRRLNDGLREYKWKDELANLVKKRR